jgi:hypothetical protein
MWKGSIAAFVLLLVSCRGATDPADIRVALETDFDLALGQTAEVQSSGLKIHFSAVPQDSRCPPHAFCFWAGDARVDLFVWKEGLPGRGCGEAELHTNTAIGPAVVTFDVYALQLRSLWPEFKTGESYVVTLRVVELSAGREASVLAS